MTKLIYLGCLSSIKYKDTCANAIKIINFLDDDFVTLENPPCCGALSYHLASDEELKNHITFVNNWFKAHEVTEIVTICAGCYNYLSHYYKEFILDFNIKIQHLMQFVAQPENLQKLNLKKEGKTLSVSYHDACHLKNADVPIIEEPRTILNSIDGIKLKEMENREKLSICCGAGGGVYSIFKENSDYNALAIFKQMKGTKALITACPFCYTALKRVQENKENKVRNPVIKFEDFIVKLMDGVEPIN